ncbi:RNA polymerase subunit sigma [Roseateles aquatilis]|uniref:RNA polymerase subunit sigma n=1 Tax=Roseateles aquatilis TaxID=431061 RepID=A0A246JI41_9BURK|nr:sigma-70 family RNA polymerase sigma factor [Roseateles aquatilis]OWQ92281.1 RNA polymerase subunit sigma [Roseateles aquatilis]
MSAQPMTHQLVGSLYVEHHGWLQSLLRRQLGCAVDAADLAQDTFERLLNRREQVSWREPRAYLTTIARGLVIDLYRRRDLERAFHDALLASPEPLALSAEDRAILLETLQAVDQMLDGLPRAARDAFLMSQLDGLTYREIAGALQVTERTVASYMAKAMTRCLALAA